MQPQKKVNTPHVKQVNVLPVNAKNILQERPTNIAAKNRENMAAGNGESTTVKKVVTAKRVKNQGIVIVQSRHVWKLEKVFSLL